MAMKKGGLGKGLDSLIPKNETKNQVSEVVNTDVKDKSEQVVKLTSIEPNPLQPRKQFDEDTLLELSESIKQFGVIQPITVRKVNDMYQIVAGERRWRASRLAGLKEVPVIIKEYTDQEVMEIGLIENIQRQDLNPIEEAIAYKKLLNEYNLKQDELAERVSKSRTVITNSMRLLKLDDRVQQMIVDEMLTTGHARALLAIDDVELQYKTAVKIFDEKLSVREVEKLIKALKSPKKEKINKEPDIIMKDLETKIIDRLGTKVNIKQGSNNKGKIEIEYFSTEEFERLFDILMGGM